MVVGGSRRAMVTLVFVLSFIFVVRSAENCAPELFEGCDWIDRDQTKCDCFKEFKCDGDSTKIVALEECPSKKEEPWFVVVPGVFEIGTPCNPVSLKFESPNMVSLITPLDLEKEQDTNYFCEKYFIVEKEPKVATLVFKDVNEYYPMPNSGPTQSQIKVDENQESHILATIQYKDNDFGETAGMTATVKFPTATEAAVEIRNQHLNEKSAFEVELWTTEPLDYEDNNFYEFNIEFTSVDDLGVASSSNHTVYLFVQDQGDTPPIWVKPVFFVNFPEGEKGRSVFSVTARDGDFVVNNDIRYFIVSESVPGYFKVDNISGEVTNIEKIDYAELHSIDIASIVLTLEAREYYKNGTEASKPMCSSHETMVIIEDLNDQTPSFSISYLELSVDELLPGVSSKPVDLQTQVYIKDMDAGPNGTYTLKADNGLIVNSGKLTGKTQLEVKMTTTPETTFDFEEEQDTPRHFLITAVEEADPSHNSNLVLNITLKDLNDNSPEFEKAKYDVVVPEDFQVGIPFDTDIVATDKDITEEFGTKSIRYSLSDCSGIAIEPVNGQVTVMENALDFEDDTKRYFECKLRARDLKGKDEFNEGTSILTITVEDVNDTPPCIVELPDSEVDENSEEGTLITHVLVNDKDTTADIEFSLDVVAAKDKNGNLITDLKPLKNWFTVVEVSTPLEKSVISPTEDTQNAFSDPSLDYNFMAHIKVGSEAPDFELATEVTLSVTAKDVNTISKNDRVSDEVVITLRDCNDVGPLLKVLGEFKVEENRNDANVGWLEGEDPDTEDQGKLTFTCEENDYVVIENDSGRGLMKTKATANIDREEIGKFEVTVTVIDMANSTDSGTVTVTVIDVNDEKPSMDKTTCPNTKNISESTKNDTSVYSVTGSDRDEGINAEIRYRLQSDSSSATKDLMTPFRLDAVSGEIFVLKDGNLKDLDREKYAFWELSIYPVDCGDGNMDCIVNVGSSCIVNITLDDVNDNGPEFSDQPSPLPADEDTKKGTDIGRLAFVEDKDEANSPNSEIECKVVNTTIKDDQGKEVLVDLFEAVTYSIDGLNKYECKLKTLIDLQQKRGHYTVWISATDKGEEPRSTEEHFAVEITDVNDSEPRLMLEGCLADQEGVIYMEENKVKNGSIVPCRTSNLPLGTAIFTVKDDDTPAVNGYLSVTIDWERTIIENATLGLQKGVFKVENYDYNKFHLVANETVDRERGARYNLTLVVEDHGESQLQTESWLVVEVRDESEWEPFFCPGDVNCKLEVYVKENNTAAGTTFTEAIDVDTGGEDIIYYMLVPDSPVFEIPDETTPRLQVKGLLDREEEQRYKLIVVTSNNYEKPSQTPTGNMTLELSVVVLDENDVTPSFEADVVLASFLDSDVTGKRIPQAFKGSDLDLNDTHVCSTGNNFVWYGATANISKPFTIETNSDNDLDCDLILEFNPTAQTGYCTFDLFLEDKVGHVGKTQAKVYIITDSFISPFTFLNNKTTIANKKEEVAKAFSQAFGYDSSLDSVEEVREDGVIIDGRCIAYLHFIDSDKNEPVSRNVILVMMADPTVTNALRSNLLALDLELAISQEQDVETQAQDVRLYQILLGVVSLVLGCFVILLLSAYCFRTRSLERRVKALSTNTFGSTESLRKLQEADPVPGSNLFAGEMVNPVWSMDAPADAHGRKKDRASIGSGDSVLVGVEDNPEFRDFSAKNGDSGGKLKGVTNSSFTKSIDQISAPQPGFGGGARVNPLLASQIGDSSPAEETDLSDALHEFNFGSRGSSGNGSIEEDVSTQLNSNFSFGKPPSSSGGTNF